MYYNAFDIKIMSFGAGLILVYVQHNKTHLADPPNEIATFLCFKNTLNNGQHQREVQPSTFLLSLIRGVSIPANYYQIAIKLSALFDVFLKYKKYCYFICRISRMCFVALNIN